MNDITKFATNLSLDASGVWLPKDQRAISYPDDGNATCFEVEDESFWFQHRNHAICQLVSQYSPGDVFFDVGGGNGCVAHALKLSGEDVALVEPGPDGARNAVSRGISTVVQATLEDAGFKENSLPSVGLFDVVEHIEDHKKFMKSVFGLLRPGGTLYMTVPAYNFLWSVDDVHAGHFRRYTVSSATKLLKGLGFEVRYSGYLFAALIPAIFLFRSIPTYLGIRKSITASTTEKEHSQKVGFIGAMINRSLSLELKRIKKSRQIPLGSSCVVVASKPE